MIRSSIVSAFAVAVLCTAPASAQVSVELGSGARVDLDTEIGVRVGEPYRYRDYQSGRWYYQEHDRGRHRGHRYNAEYRGYDCRRGTYYTWEDGRRVRYQSYWCYDDRGRDFEVRRSRVVVRID